jgi:FAD/FMN-containing dehydrogenase
MFKDNQAYSAPEQVIPQLRASVKGEVISPDNPYYDQARRVFYGKFDRYPAVIVRPKNAADVASVVSLARDTGIELAVRSGGHSVAGHSTSDGGIVLDLAAMRALSIDEKRRTAWAETGLTAGEYTVAAGAHGLATGFGDTGSVGIGGITLGGGIGYLLRKYGLTIDDLLAADIVTADGSLLRVDAETHPDLFWAIRGGGGNFGVVTRFQYRLHEVDRIVGGMMILPATVDVITSLLAAAEAAPDELSIIANIMLAPPMPEIPSEHHGEPVIMALMAYTGDIEEGQRAIAPIRAITTPLADMVGPMRYPDIYKLTEGGPPIKEETAYSMFVDSVERSGAEAIVEYLKTSTAPIAVAQLRALGGAMARIPADATAFAHRHRRFLIAVGTVYEDANDAAAQQDWVNGIVGELRHGDAGVYVGFLGDEGQGRVHEAYPGATWARLAAIKAHYDPTNVFRLNQNIPPKRA